METLTKENFWNQMDEEYPVAMKKFKDWVNQYKEENNWIGLFNEQRHNDSNIDAVAPKFHDLPTGMQIGIFNEWWVSQYESLTEKDLLNDIKTFIKDRLSEKNG